MDEPLLKYGLMVVLGMLLGAIFFGGLWMTVRQMTTSKRPGLLFLTSVVLRTAIVLFGIWYCAAGNPYSIAACLLGFIGLRLRATHGAAVLGSAFGGQSERRKAQ